MAIPDSKLVLLRAMLIIAAGFWVFAPALHGDWLMDDDMYLSQNVLVNDPARLWKIWFSPGSLIEYYPIEATVQAEQWRLWNLDPQGGRFGYHLTNLLLHLTSALLVWRLLTKFGLRFAWLGGLLFAIHPVVVESVAWISELKNTLSLPPFLLALCVWIDYDERRRPRDYFLALGLFVLAMLCKISMALFPFVMLLYAWWKRGRLDRRDLISAAPFFAVSLVLGATTVWCGEVYRASHLQSAAPPYIGDFWTHLALAGWSIAFYFAKCVWPMGMSFVYPKWPVDSHAWAAYLPWPILLGVIGWLWLKRRTWGRHALLGLGFFLLNLAPFVGFNSVSYMQFTWVMDHFAYLPMIGLTGLAIAALEDIENKLAPRARPALGVAAAAVLALLALESQSYAATFVGPEELWTHTLARDPNCPLAHNNLGNVLLQTGRVPQAIAEYERALQFDPGMVEAHNNLAFAYQETGQLDQAISQYELSLKSDPHFYLAHRNLADVLFQAGRMQEALDHYQQDLLVNPGDTHAREQVARIQAMITPR